MNRVNNIYKKNLRELEGASVVYPYKEATEGSLFFYNIGSFNMALPWLILSSQNQRQNTKLNLVAIKKIHAMSNPDNVGVMKKSVNASHNPCGRCHTKGIDTFSFAWENISNTPLSTNIIHIIYLS